MQASSIIAVNNLDKLLSYMIARIFVLLVLFTSWSGLAAQDQNKIKLYYNKIGTTPDSLGVAGPFAGLTGRDGNILMIAGGANFPEPFWESGKDYHKEIYLGQLDDQGGIKWLDSEFELPCEVAYGASVTVDQGVVCIGGNGPDMVYDKVFIISYDEIKEDLIYYELPSLPSPSTNGGAALVGDYIYYSCGQTGTGLETATNSFWRLNISQLEEFLSDPGSPYPGEWEIMAPLPGPARAFQTVAAQHNGHSRCLYIIGGRRLKDDYSGDEPFQFLKDIWEFDPMNPANPWSRKADAPVNIMAAPGSPYGQSHIFILGGADGSLIYKADSLKNDHPGFPKIAWAYHTITGTWVDLGDIPSNQVTTTALLWNKKIIIPSGEIRPRVRSSSIWEIAVPEDERRFGWLNYTTLIVYLAAMLMVGVYFARRNRNTNDFFRGGQRVPWWAAACSIFATMLSSLTYMSVPAKAYMTNWEYLLGYPIIFLTAILVIYLILPFFRQIDATSAYEYLDKRFNRGARYLGSGFFILFQVGRMAIVMFLSALALSAITPFTPGQCILIMGVLSIVYCTLGGVEAVIWTDTLQTFVLLGGAILIFILVLLKLDGGMSEFIRTASSDHKFKMVNWDWDLYSYTTAAFWVIIIGALGQNLVSYGSDQAVVQRYMTTSDQKKAAKSILTNGIMSVPAGLLFFAVGTALFVFYKSHPSGIDPNFQNDAIMPLFIVQEVPAGLAGLIIAGIFAAAQSTISTSMNSIATATVTDFIRPFGPFGSEKSYLNLARFLTVFFGAAGTGLALVFASADIKSLLDQFFAVLGLFGGALGGLFLLGMFTRKAHGRGAVAGAVIGAIVLFIVSRFTQTHVYLYAAIGIVTTMSSGWVLSLILPSAEKDIAGLTVFDLKRKK